MTTNVKKKLFSLIVGAALIGTVAAISVNNLPNAIHRDMQITSTKTISSTISQEVNSMADTSTNIDSSEKADNTNSESVSSTASETTSNTASQVSADNSSNSNSSHTTSVVTLPSGIQITQNTDQGAASTTASN